MKFFSHNYFWVFLFIFQMGFYKIIGNSENFIADFYLPFYLKFQSTYIKIFNVFPFSVGDFLYLISPLSLIFYLIRLCIYIRKKRLYWIKKSLKSLLLFCNVFIFCFYWFFGFLYYDTQLKRALSITTISMNELKLLATKYLIKTKELSYKTSISNIENQQNSLNDAVVLFKDSIVNLKIKSTKNVKKSMYSNALSYLGVAGYYNPFTAETQYNCNIPAHNIPFTLAHEKSHQLGFASENEANFIGFLIAKKSKDRSVQYSANFMALKYLLSQIYDKDSLFVKNCISNYSKKMKIDRAIEKQYFKEYQGKLTSVFSQVNDFYLKLNNQKGIESYNEFVTLLVYYEKKEALSKDKTSKK